MSLAPTWDVRATDMWLFRLTSHNPDIIDACWNLLSYTGNNMGCNSATRPSPYDAGPIPTSSGTENFRVDIRLRNFGSTSVNVAMDFQVIGAQTGNQGSLVSAPSTVLAPGDEAVWPLWVQMWGEDIYLRLWVRNVDVAGPNCGVQQPPPYPVTCGRGELYDFSASGSPTQGWRHLVYIKNGSTQETITVTLDRTSAVQGDKVTAVGKGMPDGAPCSARLNTSSGKNYIVGTGSAQQGITFVFNIPADAPTGGAYVVIVDDSTGVGGRAPITIMGIGPSGYNITVHIQDAQGTPVQGATVTVS